MNTMTLPVKVAEVEDLIIGLQALAEERPPRMRIKCGRFILSRHTDTILITADGNERVGLCDECHLVKSMRCGEI